jgi:hypothetical protein
MMTAPKDFEAAAKAALDREMSLMRQQAAKRAQDAATAAADPARQLAKRQLIAGAYAVPGAVGKALRQRRAELEHAAVRHAVDGPETSFGRDSW